MAWLRKRCILSCLKVLRRLTKIHICAHSSKNCMGWRKHPVFGIPGSIAASLGWDSPKVKQMWTFTIFWLQVNCWFFLYVDNLIPIGDDNLIKYCKEDLSSGFEMKDLGLMHYFLGMEVWQGDEEHFFSVRVGMPLIYSKVFTWRAINPWRLL